MNKGNREYFMADCEDGYTKVPNLLLEALAVAQLNAAQKSICLYIIRRTYGWNRTEDAISLSEFADGCGTTRPYICRQLNCLLKKNIIRRLFHEPGKTSVYSIVPSLQEWSPECIDLNLIARNDSNHIYEPDRSSMDPHDCILSNYQALPDHAAADQDQPLSSRTTVDPTVVSVQTTELLPDQTTPLLSERITVNQPSALEPPEFEHNLKKERKKKNKRKTYSDDSIEFQLSQLLLVKILEHIPGFKLPDLQKWSEEMALMIRLDQRPVEEIREVILFAQNDSFWQNNILSPGKLRKQYDMLNGKRRKTQTAPPVSRFEPFWDPSP